MPEHFSGGSDKTIGKLIILEEYLDVYTTIMQSHWDSELWYVDTHAGTGKTTIDEYGVIIDGSALRAVAQYQDQFDGYYFYEIDQERFTTLHETLADEVAGVEFEVYEKDPDHREAFDVAYCDDPQIAVIRMDSNEGASWLAENSDDGRHWFTFVDPKGLTAKRETIDTLIDRQFIDILITYQTTGILRSAAEGAEHAHQAVTRTIGDADWPHAATPDEYVEEYKQRIRRDSSFSIESKPMLSEHDRSVRFDLVFASRNDEACRIMKEEIMEQSRLLDKITEEIEEARVSQEQSGLSDFI